MAQARLWGMVGQVGSLDRRKLMKAFLLLLLVSMLSFIAVPVDYGYAQSAACPYIVNGTPVNKGHVSLWQTFKSWFQPNPSIVNK